MQKIRKYLPTFSSKRLKRFFRQKARRTAGQSDGRRDKINFIRQPNKAAAKRESSTNAKFSKKKLFLPPLKRTRTCANQGVRNVSFFGKFYVTTE